MSKNDTHTYATTPQNDSYTVGELGNAGNEKVPNYGVCMGIVIGVDMATKFLKVNVNNQVIPNCVYAAGVFSSLLGVSVSSVPPIGSKVCCLVTPTGTFVIGTQPEYNKALGVFGGNITGVNEYDNALDETFYHDIESDPSKGCDVGTGYNLKRDIFPGELDITTNMGTAIRLLTHLVQLDSGGIAKIEAHLINDMVRIVNNYFAHHNCGGDTLIWQNGRNNYEEHFTSYPHEAAGKKDPSDPLAEEKLCDKVYDLRPEDDPFDATGRWRVSKYIGFLGDIVHFWVTNPSETLSNYGSESVRAGNFRSWIGADGTLVIQSAGEIIVQAKEQIPIPEIQHTWNNPQHISKFIQEANERYTEIWCKGARYSKDMQQSCWQMREYLRWLVLYHANCRWLQMRDKNYCKLKREVQAFINNGTCEEPDKWNNRHGPAGSQAFVHLNPAGNIELVSGSYTSVILEGNGNGIHIDTPGDVEIKCGGKFTVTANTIHMKSYGITELVSMAGSIYTKARTALNLLCELGRVWIKGDAPEKELSEQEAKSLIAPNEAIQLKEYGVVIDSSQRKTLIHGNTGVDVVTSNGDIKLDTPNDGDIVFHTNNWYTNVTKDVMMKAQTWTTSTAQTYFHYDSYMKLDDIALLSHSDIQVNGTIKGRLVTSSTNMISATGYSSGGKNIHIGLYTDEVYKSKIVPLITVNQDTIAQKDLDDKLGELQNKSPEAYLTQFDEKEFEGGKNMFNFPKYKSDSSDDDVGASDVLVCAPWTEAIENGVGGYDTFTEKVKFTERDPRSIVLSAPRTGDSRYWPGDKPQFVMARVMIPEPIGESTDVDYAGIPHDNPGFKKIGVTYYFNNGTDRYEFEK